MCVRAIWREIWRFVWVIIGGDGWMGWDGMICALVFSGYTYGFLIFELLIRVQCSIIDEIQLYVLSPLYREVVHDR